jgi:hypothetical protein
MAIQDFAKVSIFLIIIIVVGESLTAGNYRRISNTAIVDLTIESFEIHNENIME